MSVSGRTRALSHTIRYSLLQQVFPGLDVGEEDEYYEELPTDLHQKINENLERLLDRPDSLRRGDTVFFESPANKYGRFFVDSSDNTDLFGRWRLIREDSGDENEYGDHMGRIPSCFLVPSQFPPRYWFTGDYIEFVPFRGQTIGRPLTRNDFCQMTATWKNQSYDVLVLPLTIGDTVYYFTDLQDIDTASLDRLIDELQTNPVERVGFLGDNDPTILHGVVGKGTQDIREPIDKDHIISLRDI